MPTISVIVPVYKVEPYLRACIDSILYQTYKDFELILIDDGSPDNCGAICDEYAAKDKRVRVIHQENQGVSAARNLGMQEGRGKYIAFVDPDDVIHPQMYELLVPVLEYSDYPFVHCAFHRSHDEDACSFPDRFSFSVDDIQELTSEDGMVRMMDGTNYGHFIWKGLYRAKYIIDFVFPIGVRWEDVIWSGEIVGNAGKYAFVPYDLYAYRINSSGLVKTVTWAVYEDYFKAMVNYMELTKELTPSVLNEVCLLTYQAMIYGYDTLATSGIRIGDEAKKQIVAYSKKCNLSVSSIMKSNLHLRRKMIYYVCMLDFPAGCRLRRSLIR